jgi:hypothetical protein
MTTGSDPQPSSIGGQLSSKSLAVEAFTRRWYESLSVTRLAKFKTIIITRHLIW